MSQPYRADIDGLRAVAVIAVIAFHAFPKHVPSGFVGVDIFFVISGFLISGILLDAIARGTMSIGEFYVRRVRRIFPALVLVMGVYLVAGWFVMPPVQYEHMGKHAFFGSVFIANLSLWREGGYFDMSVELKPMLHLWSLGVEEQFYLLWPLGLWVMARRRWNLVAGTAVLALASFALNVYEAPRHPNATFYFPYTLLGNLDGRVARGGVTAAGGLAWPVWCTANHALVRRGAAGRVVCG
jgi:peptidoglycan/LPS O-acetylase OafA/YrhL